ncbi:hypothetical protein [Bacillus pumilus]|uniref:hypothetical protein n=1 Tax=Bacillus pumilus TaxID=1408 RepID=UPI0011A63E66|nr:hypothetical protein [Bacillus pumilus]
MKDYKINQSGAKIYSDLNKHELLQIPTLKNTSEDGSVYHVLSLGVIGTHTTGLVPVATIKDSEGKVAAYRLPSALADWVAFNMGLGVNVFPSDVEFGIIDGRPYAEVL